MKAIQIQNVGGVEVLQYTDVPRPTVSPNTVLVKNHAIGVNFIDIYQRTGVYTLSLPAILGREGAGVVEQIGEGVENIAAGDRVAYMGPSSYAEYTVASANHVYKLPENVDFKLGAAALLQGLTAWTLVTQAYAIKKGDWVLIHAAAGGTGLLLTQIAKHLGANVIGTVSTPEKAEQASRAGADHVINYTTSDVLSGVKALTSNEGVNVAYDGVGKDTFDTSLASLRRLGWMVSFGNASGVVPPFSLLRLSEKNVTLVRPTLFNYIATREEFNKYCEEFFALLVAQKVDIKIHKTYKLSDVKQAHSDLEGRKTSGKLVLEP
ncbi:10333_t:CDS:2 [Paraglomus brasilianum]|uniref:Probable quinone oxidoreductase n=1 Tax=Paraglomus brasilianum TaxID=144538 RepID=A0A9N9GMZ0_9GLOM|nr:10333_t:CDS:2 [Paraglomus brasilianum]